jgi:hypothetical protein
MRLVLPPPNGTGVYGVTGDSIRDDGAGVRATAAMPSSCGLLAEHASGGYAGSFMGDVHIEARNFPGTVRGGSLDQQRCARLAKLASARP